MILEDIENDQLNCISLLIQHHVSCSLSQNHQGYRISEDRNRFLKQKLHLFDGRKSWGRMDEIGE